MDTEGTIRGAVEFFRSFEFLQCFNKLDLFILFRIIHFMSIQNLNPKLPATQDKAPNIYKVATNVKIGFQLISLISHSSIATYHGLSTWLKSKSSDIKE